MSSFPRIVHAHLAAPEPERQQLRERLAQAGYQLIWLDGDEHAAIELPRIRILACADLPAVAWEQARALEHVHVMGAGVDHLELSALPAQLLITNSRGIHGPEMRDHVLALMLAFERHLPRLIAQQAERQWLPFAGGTLHNKTATILGLGHVGASIAKACKALGMTVLATRARPQRASAFDEYVDEVQGPEQTRRLIAAADYLLVCLPATAHTRGLVDAAMLATMPSHAVLIVVGRGGIVDEDALIDALSTDQLRAAALDVFAHEPLAADHRLWSTPRLLISPHLAGWSVHYLKRAFDALLSNRRAIEAGGSPLTEVDRQLGY